MSSASLPSQVVTLQTLGSRARFASFVATSEFTGRGLLFAAQVVTARLLGPTEFGHLAPQLVAANFLWVVLELGHDRLLVVRTSEAPEKASLFLNAALQLRIAGSLVAAAGAFAAVIEGMLPAFSLALVGWAVAESLVRAIRLSQIGRLRSHVDAAIHVFQRIVTLLVVVAMTGDAPSAAVAYGLSNGLVLALLLTLRLAKFVPIRIDYLQALMAGSLPLFLSSLVALVSQLDVVWLSIATSDATQVGWYRSITQLQVAAVLPGQVMASVALPLLVQQQRTTVPTNRLQYSVPFVDGGCLVGAGLAVASSPIERTLFGAAYTPAAAAGPPLGLAVLLVYLNWLFATTRIAGRQERHVFRATAAGALISVGGNALLIPSFGFVGSAWVRALTEAVTATIFVLSARRMNRARG